MPTMTTFDRITCIPAILNDQPTFGGMRLTERRVIEALAVFPNRDDLRREYPEPEPEDIHQALAASLGQAYPSEGFGSTTP